MVLGPCPARLIDESVSRYRICIAAGVLRISAASRINLADSTSASDVITRDSPRRLACAADDNDSCNSSEISMSLTSVASI